MADILPIRPGLTGAGTWHLGPEPGESMVSSFLTHQAAMTAAGDITATATSAAVVYYGQNGPFVQWSATPSAQDLAEMARALADGVRAARSGDDPNEVAYHQWQQRQAERMRAAEARARHVRANPWTTECPCERRYPTEERAARHERNCPHRSH